MDKLVGNEVRYACFTLVYAIHVYTRDVSGE